MRVTFQDLFQKGDVAINAAAERLATAERQVATGLRISVPSDDPGATAGAITEKGIIAANDQYTQASSAANSQLTAADSTLSDIVNQLSTAQSATLGARGSTQTAQQRAAVAQQLLGIRDTLAADINAQFGGRYLFSGTNSTVAPYVALGGGNFSSYQGNASAVSIDIGTGRSVQVTVNGGQIFQGSDPQNILNALTTLATAVQAGDETGMGQGLTALSNAFNRATQAQTVVGTALGQIASNDTQLLAIGLDAKTADSKLEDANLADAATEETQAETAYRAALAAVAHLNTTSLMDYIK